MTEQPYRGNAVRYVVQYSGGAGSYEAARRIIEREGRNGVVLLFADTLIEDASLYRFLDETSARLGVPVTRIADGRTPWQVFRDERFIGNSRVDPCSKILKRQLCDKWMRENAPDATSVLGLDWTEEHRITSAQARLAAMGWRTEFPLNEAPWFSKTATLRSLEAQGITIPRLYLLGFSHNNCGGFCVKAGQGHFARLLRELPDVYARHEAEEEATREYLGRYDIGVLTDRRGGQRVPMTLRQFRERVQAKTLAPDLFDIGGCGCFSPVEELA